MRLIPSSSGPLLYLITDRQQLPRRERRSELDSLFDFVSEALHAGVDMVQIRERDLTARELTRLVAPLVTLAARFDARVLVNDCADVAASTGAGVHLTTRSLAPEVIRSIFGDDMLIGASTHTMEEAASAESGGADFVVFGPVFETASKRIYGPPVGLDSFEETAAHLAIPVLAIGGINMSNYRLPLERGGAGLAAISLFAASSDLRYVVSAIKAGQ